MRRKLPKGAGRLRVRRGDDTLLIVSSAPFDGGRPVTTAEAALMVAEAVERLHVRRNAYRQLGAWSDHKPTPWKLVAKMPGTLDAGRVERAAGVLDATARRLRCASGLLFRCPGREEAEEMGRRVGQALLKSTDGGKDKKPFVRTFHPPPPPDGPDEYDPGADPWT
jgi:hypothetical protein